MSDLRERPRWTVRWPGAAGLVLLFLAGCGASPHAPALATEDEPYQNEREGFGFQPPAGWTQIGLSAAPAGPAPQERLLVKYARLSSDKAAILRVSVVDLPESTSLADFLDKRSPGRGWQPVSPSEPLKLDGRPALRRVYAGRQEKEATIREIVAVQRDQRVYLFTGTFPQGDTKAREKVRQAVASLSWKSDADR
jgi:hypothetical protein